MFQLLPGAGWEGGAAAGTAFVSLGESRVNFEWGSRESWRVKRAEREIEQMERVESRVGERRIAG
jgi:hypothetical protein